MQQEIRFATFNVCNLAPPGVKLYDNLLPTTPEEYEAKLNWTAHQIDLLDADVIGFQEIFSQATLKEVLARTRRYREAFGLARDTSRADRMPLVLSSRSRAISRLSDEAAGEALKAVFAEAALLAERQGDGDSAAALRHASVHWLRHSMLTNHANNGVQLKTLQDTAGHANIATTAAYLHKTDNERHDEIIGSVKGKDEA